jgi:hypothetical protein
VLGKRNQLASHLGINKMHISERKMIRGDTDSLMQRITSGLQYT